MSETKHPLESLLVRPIPLAPVIESIEATGAWKRYEEWRISTVTTTDIARTGKPDHLAYHVRVECDYVLEAHCPTIARAVEIAAVFEAVIREMWSTFGWPTWATKAQLKPPSDAV